MKVTSLPSPNFGYRNSLGATGGRGVAGRHGHSVLFIVMHVYGGVFNQANREWILRAGTPVSYNDLVLTSGEIITLVDPMNPAWANGKVANPTLSGLKRSGSGYINPNLYTHAICREGHNHHVPTKAQMDALVYITRLRAKQHDLRLDRSVLVGHNEIDSINRAYCPGSGLNWLEFQKALGIVPERQEYVVQRGDTAWGISRRFGIPMPKFAGANPHIKDLAKIYPGQTLYLPPKEYD